MTSKLKGHKKFCYLFLLLLCTFAVLLTSGSVLTVAYAADDEPPTAFWISMSYDFSGSRVTYKTSVTNISFAYIYHCLRFVYNGYTVPSGFNIDYEMNIDLNGCTLKGEDINLKAKANVYDYAGGGQGSFYVSNNGDASYHGSDTTLAGFTVRSDSNGKLKLYSGRLSFLFCSDGKTENGDNLTVALPAGYKYVAKQKTSKGGALLPMTYAWAKANDVFTNNASSDYDYLTVQQCSHPQITNGVCDYCNATIDGTEALATAKRELEEAKQALNDAIDKKADTETLTKKVQELNTAIENAKKACNEYADGKDATLKTTLEEEITNVQTTLQQAVNDAISKASSDLDAAKQELQKQIDENATGVSNNAQAIADAKKDYQAKIDAANNLITGLQTKDGEQDTAIAGLQTSVSNLQTSLEEAQTDLNTKITNAISKASSELDKAKQELNASIATKADKATIEARIEELNQAIKNAQTISDASANQKDETLKATLNANINNTKSELEAIISSLADRLDRAEERIDQNETEIQTLKILTFATTVVMFLFGIGSVVTVLTLKRFAANGTRKKAE